jgi:membrane protein DedA with SNARE-associated domain
METILALVRDYGTAVYLLLFAYCALKSGSLPLFAGYAAQTGALDVATVAAATFAGGYLGDEARFSLARRYGHRLSTGRPRIARLIARGTDLLDRYGLFYVFLYRYPKGMRTIGALPVGLTTMRWQSFTALNAASAALWTGLLVGAGFVFGKTLEQAVASNWAAASVLLLLAFAGLTGWLWWRASRMAPSQPAPAHPPAADINRPA